MEKDGLVFYVKARAFKAKATSSRPRPDSPKPRPRPRNLALRPRPGINIPASFGVLKRRAGATRLRSFSSHVYVYCEPCDFLFVAC